MDLIPLEVLDTPINIIGAGAIGSFTALALAKMGFNNITAIDFDHIDVENMNCQFYRFSDIGSLKVTALQSLIQDFTRTEITAINDVWNGQIMEGITICAVDSMAVRKQVYEAYNRKAFKTMAVIDPRMGAETALMYAYNPLSPSECDEYSKTLYSDEDAVQERCTAKATMYTACMLSGLVAKTVKNIVCKEESSRNLIWDINADDMIALKRA
jgi:molybdopterin/thiamine biosynthesis adenylyltransferase